MHQQARVYTLQISTVHEIFDIEKFNQKIKLKVWTNIDPSQITP